MTKDEALKLAFEAFQYVVTPSGGTRAYVWDSNEARLVADAYRALEKALAQHDSVQAKPEPEQEPVALIIDGVLVKSALPEKYTGHLYTTPPQRTWVGLTPEEVEDAIVESNLLDDYPQDFVAIIETKLKEKNSA